jgi:hypothetical protein
MCKDEELGKFGRAPYGVATFRASLRSVLRTLRPYMRLTHPPNSIEFNFKKF